jgi:type II pantothenate kinase
MSHDQSYRFLQFVGVAALSLGVVLYTRWRMKQELNQRRKKKKLGSINIGGIFGMDVGGTLTKIVYFERASLQNSDLSQSQTSTRKDANASVSLSPPKMKRESSIDELNTPDHIAALDEMYRYMGESKSFASTDDALTFYSSVLGGRMHFLRFETRMMLNAIDQLSTTGVTQNIRTIGCTGGGAHKYAEAMADQLDITVIQTDELECLVRGMHFTLMNVPGECYAYRYVGGDKGPAEWVKDVKEDTKKINIMDDSSFGFPYLVVNIGSGVSILKVSSTDKFERVSGTSLGGGTYWGLCRLFTRCSTFEEAIDLAETGDSKQIDMLVRDIYGGSYGNMSLAGDMVASSFGKLVMKENPREGLLEQDLAIALLMMITNNIGQVAYLNAKLHNCSRIFFVGSFLRHNSISCRRLSFAINFWSKATMEALFLEHDGYFGALGTFLQSAFGHDVDKIINMSSKANERTQSDSNSISEMSSQMRPRSRSIDSGAGSTSLFGLRKSPASGSKQRKHNCSIDNDVLSPINDDEEGSALRFVAVRNEVHPMANQKPRSASSLPKTHEVADSIKSSGSIAGRSRVGSAPD